jgi:hypothetical protein
VCVRACVYVCVLFMVDQEVLGQISSPITAAFPCQFYSTIASLLIHSSMTEAIQFQKLNVIK